MAYPRPLRLGSRTGPSTFGVPASWQLPFAAGSLAMVLAVGYSAAAGLEVYLAAAAACLAIFLRPHAVLLATLAAILASGRQLTKIRLTESLYLTEILLAILVAAVVFQIITSDRLTRGLKVAIGLNLLLWIPAAVGILLKTTTPYLTWLPNFAIVYYALFAVLAASIPVTDRLYVRLFQAVLIGCAIAFVLVFTGNAGSGQDLQVGPSLTRIAHGSFAFPFGIAPLVLIAAVRERILGMRWLVAAAPFIVALALMNQRAAWLGFALALAALLDLRSKLVVLLVVAGVGVAAALFFTEPAPGPPEGVYAQLERARSVKNTRDPNVRFRLDFSKNVVADSARSPFFGQGFDPYPERLVPRHTAFGTRNDPHNSFVALGYRLGLIPLAILLALVGVYLVRAQRAAKEEPSPVRRAAFRALAGVIVYSGLLSAFNVFLEFPYSAPLFWAPLGFLIALLFSRSAEESQDVPQPAPTRP